MRLVTIDLDKLKYANLTGTNLGWVNEVDISNAIVKSAWTPIEEDVPCEGEEVLVTRHLRFCNQSAPENEVMILRYFGEGPEGEAFIGRGEEEWFFDVTAWMPKPKPYKSRNEVEG